MHGYEFKEAIGDALALLNLEYAARVAGGLQAVRASSTPAASTSHERRVDAPWLKGVGLGIGVGGVRVDFGYKLDAVPARFRCCCGSAGRSDPACRSRCSSARSCASCCSATPRPPRSTSRSRTSQRRRRGDRRRSSCATSFRIGSRKLLDDGGVLHLRVQAELWESRPVWDRLVYPAIVRVFRFGPRAGGAQLSITDPDGAADDLSAVPQPMPVVVDLGDSDRVTPTEAVLRARRRDAGHAGRTEVDEVGDAVFGSEAETNGLGVARPAGVPDGAAGERLSAERVSRSGKRKLVGAEILRRRRCQTADHSGRHGVRLQPDLRTMQRADEIGGRVRRTSQRSRRASRPAQTTAASKIAPSRLALITSASCQIGAAQIGVTQIRVHRGCVACERRAAQADAARNRFRVRIMPSQLFTVEHHRDIRVCRPPVIPEGRRT